ncbi:sugar transferase [Alphaproteobacteria bacterium KMM 3653]|uniref:Sugar transferase n=1 Tax=Harenicola maris TaxID=2841044 RepID=A0AAP2CRC5_9RHOB|nr:sugar transferase [Harenicola maris]
MRPGKRLFDIVLALILLVPGLPAMAIIAVIILLRDGRPVLFVSERMRAPGQAFRLYKFRTMSLSDDLSIIRPLGGDQVHRVTPIGRVLRRTRLDELPQLFNVLKGDISFVGPRPPLRKYVEAYPEIYARVLATPPGITGLATVLYHAHEEWILGQETSAEATEAAYRRRCVPWKAHLDILYQQKQSLGLDLYLIVLTSAKILPLPGKRAARLRGHK